MLDVCVCVCVCVYVFCCCYYYFWPKTNRLPDIFPAKMGLFGISRELQFGVGIHGEHARQGKENTFIERNVGRTVVKESMAFQWLCPCQERRGVFLLPVGLCYCYRVLGAPLSGLPTLFNWGFCLLIFNISPFWSRSFSESIFYQESGFLVSVAFCPSMPGRTFPGCSISCWRESARIGKLMMSCLSNKEG